MSKKTTAQLNREIAEVLDDARMFGRYAHDRDDARMFGRYARRMDQTRAQALVNARAEGFAAHQLGAVEEGWEGERSDTMHGGFPSGDSVHATRRRKGAMDTSPPRRSTGGNGWGGMCLAGKHGLDFEGQDCDVCTHERGGPCQRNCRKCHADRRRGFVSGEGAHATRRRAQVVLDTSAYRRLHGAEPRGSGNWTFVIGKREYSYSDDPALYRPAESRGVYKAGHSEMAFARAREHAIAEAKRRGATIVGVGP